MTIINFNISIDYLSDKFDFTEKAEEFMLSVFDCMTSKIYFVENDKIIYYNKEKQEKIEYDINIGIIGKVIKLKDILGYQNLKNSPDYNSIIDIHSTNGILTFPVLELKTKETKAVVQVPFLGKIHKNGKPKDIIVKLIKNFRKCIKHWIHKNGY